MIHKNKQTLSSTYLLSDKLNCCFGCW